jgi:hypothetical protein
MAISDFFMPTQTGKNPMPVSKIKEEKEFEITTRIRLFKKASKLIAPIIAEHGIESYRGGGGAVLVPGQMYSAVDQHIEHILNVANWLEEGIKDNA